MKWQIFDNINIDVDNKEMQFCPVWWWSENNNQRTPTNCGKILWRKTIKEEDKQALIATRLSVLPCICKYSTMYL